MNNESPNRPIIANLSERFERRYGNLWLASNDIDDRENLRERIYEWANELDAEAIHPDTTAKIASMVLDMEEFGRYPPSLNRILSLCKEFNKMFNANDSGHLYLAMKRLDERFGFTYGRLWDMQDKDKCKRRLDHWQQEILSHEYDAQTVSIAVRTIIKKPSFITYPPTLPMFLMECAFCKINEVFIDPREAFALAYQSNIEMHPAIKGARQSIGSHALRVSRETAMSRRFEEVYIEECLKYIKDPQLYINSVQKPESNAACENDTIANNNSDFFKTLKAKCH